MKNKFLIILIFVFLFSFNLISYDLGFIVGTVNNPNTFLYGLSGSMRLIVPTLKVEFEIYSKTEYSNSTMSVVVKINPKFGKFSVYGILGAGTEYEDITFDFSEYNGFTFIGGGAHLYLIDIMSLRFDFRLLSFSTINRLRLSLGLFVHI